MSDTDYEITRDFDNKSGLVMGDTRSGSWRILNPVYIGIVLTEKQLNGKMLRVQGHSNNWDKAEGICRRWVEDREISPNLLTDPVREAKL